VGSPVTEAVGLFKMINTNGDDIASLRRLISVSPAEESESREWAEQSPVLRGRIEAMLRFRGEVAREFDRLLAATSR
jgi:hypothetical protein